MGRSGEERRERKSEERAWGKREGGGGDGARGEGRGEGGPWATKKKAGGSGATLIKNQLKRTCGSIF